MAIARPPTTYRCLDCDWSTRVGTSSDALVEGSTHFSRCPRCNGSRVVNEPTSASAVEALAGMLADLPKFLRR